MKFYSTNHQSPIVSLREAVFKGLPDDNGLYTPESIPTLQDSFFLGAQKLTFVNIAFEMSRSLIGDQVPEEALNDIVSNAFDFDVPLVQLDANVYVLELFHGPTLAFKDFGARFMARLMSHFIETSQQEINILVATSGDTGSAVAQGFLGVPGIKVTLLYPRGKVSDLQEKQLTTNGQNIKALEVQGTFDDCQKMVKQAFLDVEVNKNQKLTSANSINIARLIPQSFYYMYAWSRLKESSNDIVFSVPSGNFGNLSGGLLARKMGMPVDQFVVATNINRIIPKYLESGIFDPQPSIQTLANAMDVGNPSNFPRLKSLLDDDYENIKHHLKGYYYDDGDTLETISEVYDQFNYFICPHSAIGYRGVKDYLKDFPESRLITLATAHPAKFVDTVNSATSSYVDIPPVLNEVMRKAKETIVIGNEYNDLKEYLLS